MKARRTIVGLVAALCVTGATLGVTAHEQDSGAQQVGTSSTVVERSVTSVGIEGCSSDCGLQDEPTDTRTAAVIIPPVTSVPTTAPVACTDTAPWPSDVVSASVAQRCDYRVTGLAHCPEDAYCAIQQIRDTSDFTGTR